MMEQNLAHTMALLIRTPATLNTLLRDLPESWTTQNEGENTWSAIAIPQALPVALLNFPKQLTKLGKRLQSFSEKHGQIVVYRVDRRGGKIQYLVSEKVRPLIVNRMPSVRHG
jgi:DNA anti-recombination protein RmuC